MHACVELYFSPRTTRKLVTFGVVNRLIRRVHAFPIVERGALSALGASSSAALVRLAVPLMTGELCYDAICTTLQRPRDEIRAAFASENIRVFEIAK